MGVTRHIAAIPTATEQRCLRCCEVLVTALSGAPAWPGKYCVVIGGKLFPNHPGAVDCEAVDLTAKEAYEPITEEEWDHIEKCYTEMSWPKALLDKVLGFEYQGRGVIPSVAEEEDKK